LYKRNITTINPQYMLFILMLCVSVKSQRSVKHIWFLPTHKANAEKPKELALSHQPPEMLDIH
jgi:hypothetical protein